MADILCIGELLWDLFPDGRRLGGAPANVAFHLTQAGRRARLVSAVGEDEPGRRALTELAAAGLDTDYVAVLAGVPTGAARVVFDEAGAHGFAIDQDAAWDRLAVTPTLLAAAAAAPAIVYGTLAQRSHAGRGAIRRLMEAAPHALKVLDLNLRQPFVDAEVVRESLEAADVLKLDKNELASLPSLLGETAGAGLPRRLIERFGLVRIYITLGAAGCEVHDDAGNLTEEAPAVRVVDTVGAGDAFTAVMVDGELRGLAPVEIARRANAAGAFVASQRGAMAPWPDRLKKELGI